MNRLILYLGLLIALMLSGCARREQPAPLSSQVLIPSQVEGATLPSSQEPASQKANFNFENWAASLDRA